MVQGEDREPVQAVTESGPGDTMNTTDGPKDGKKSVLKKVTDKARNKVKIIGSKLRKSKSQDEKREVVEGSAEDDDEEVEEQTLPVVNPKDMQVPLDEYALLKQKDSEKRASEVEDKLTEGLPAQVIAEQQPQVFQDDGPPGMLQAVPTTYHYKEQREGLEEEDTGKSPAASEKFDEPREEQGAEKQRVGEELKVTNTEPSGLDSGTTDEKVKEDACRLGEKSTGSKLEEECCANKQPSGEFKHNNAPRQADEAANKENQSRFSDSAQQQEVGESATHKEHQDPHHEAPETEGGPVAAAQQDVLGSGDNASPGHPSYRDVKESEGNEDTQREVVFEDREDRAPESEHEVAPIPATHEDGLDEDKVSPGQQSYEEGKESEGDENKDPAQREGIFEDAKPDSLSEPARFTTSPEEVEDTNQKTEGGSTDESATRAYDMKPEDSATRAYDMKSEPTKDRQDSETEHEVASVPAAQQDVSEEKALAGQQSYEELKESEADETKEPAQREGIFEDAKPDALSEPAGDSTTADPPKREEVEDTDLQTKDGSRDESADMKPEDESTTAATDMNTAVDRSKPEEVEDSEVEAESKPTSGATTSADAPVEKVEEKSRSGIAEDNQVQPASSKPEDADRAQENGAPASTTHRIFNTVKDSIASKLGYSTAQDDEAAKREKVVDDKATELLQGQA